MALGEPLCANTSENLPLPHLTPTPAHDEHSVGGRANGLGFVGENSRDANRSGPGKEHHEEKDSQRGA